MARFLTNRVFAAALLASAAVGAVPAFVPQPALARDDLYAGGEVSFQVFYGRLAPYGRWFQSERWGYVWHPEDVGPDFRPYYNGYWVRTDRYGWYWVSNDEDWGDIVYHYGRWVYDPDDGWLWVPGYVWAPAWVVWREGDGTTGWFPMPPDDGFYNGDEDYSGYTPADDYYGYDRWYGPSFYVTFFSLFVFVDNDHFDDRHFHRFVRRDFHHRDKFRRTHDETHITVVNNFVVNQGVDPQRMHRRNGRPFRTVRLEDVQRRDAAQPVTVGKGRQIHRREMQERPDFRPRWMKQGGTLHATPFTARPEPKVKQPPSSENPPRMNGKPLFEPQDQERQPFTRGHRNGRLPHGAMPDDNSLPGEAGPPPGNTVVPHVIPRAVPPSSDAVVPHEDLRDEELIPGGPSSDPVMGHVGRKPFKQHQPPQTVAPPQAPVGRFEHREMPQNVVPRQAPVQRFVPQNVVLPQAPVRRFVPQNAVPQEAPVRRPEHSEPPPEQSQQRSHDEDSSPPDREPRGHRGHRPDF